MTKKVIGFHYTLKDKQGSTIDTSDGQEPLVFLEGSGMIIPGLEEKLLKMNTGDKSTIEVNASEAYGEKNDEMIITVQRSQFPPETEMSVGDHFRVNDNPQYPPFEVIKIEGDEITLDGNHPLAGIDLVFDVEITELRDATEDEIAHNHVHGPGCNH